MTIVKNTLEKILGERRFEKVRDSRAYKFGVEAFTMNTFSYVVAAPIELGIAGMDVYQHLQTRLAAAVTNTLTGRPYGIWRDWIFKLLKVKKESHWTKKYLADTLAFAGLQLPIYLANMVIAGADSDEMIKASIPVTLMAGAMGRPYGAYLDGVRKDCGIESNYLDTTERRVENEERNNC